MKRSIFLLGILIFGALMVAGVTNYDALVLGEYLSVGSYINSATYTRVGTEVLAPEFVLGHGTTLDSLGRIVMNVRNKSGASIAAGRVVTMDTTRIVFEEHNIVSGTAFTDTGGVFTSEGGPNGLCIVFNGTSSNDTIKVFGSVLTMSGISSYIDTIGTGTVATDTLFSSRVWTEIDSVFLDTTTGGANGLDSIQLYLCPYRGVTTAVAQSYIPLGVTIAAIGDNAVGQVCIMGEVAVKTKPASATYMWPGVPMYMAAGGIALPMPTAQLAGNGADSLAALYPYRILGNALGTQDDTQDSSLVLIYFNPR